MGRFSLPFSVSMVGNLCILFRRQQILCTVRMRGVSPEDSSELQSKIGALNDPVYKSLCTGKTQSLKTRKENTCLSFPWWQHVQNSLMARELEEFGVWCHPGFPHTLGVEVFKCFENTVFSACGFVDPWALVVHLFRGRKKKITLLPWKRCELSAIKGN